MKSLIMAIVTACLAAQLAIPAHAQSRTSSELQVAAPTGTPMMRQLKSRGAKVGPMSTKLKGFAARGTGAQAYQCDSVACWCSGGSDCLDLIDNEGANCKHFVCGNDHGTPVCWCDL